MEHNSNNFKGNGFGMGGEFASLKAEISKAKQGSTQISTPKDTTKTTEDFSRNLKFNRAETGKDFIPQNEEGSSIAKYKNRGTVNGLANSNAEEKVGMNVNLGENVGRVNINNNKNNAMRSKPLTNNEVAPEGLAINTNKAVKKVQINASKKSNARGASTHQINMQNVNQPVKKRRGIFRKLDFYSVFITIIVIGIIESALIYFLILR